MFDTTRNVRIYVGTGANQKKIQFRSLRAGLRYAYRDLKDHPRSKNASHTIFFEYYNGSWGSQRFIVYRIKKPNVPIQIICEAGNVFYYLKSDGTIGNSYPYSDKMLSWIR